MFYGVPASTCPTDCVITQSGGRPSSSYILWDRYPARHPFITHINMRTPADCFAYVDKLVHFGTNYSPGRVYISASAGGYGGTNYFFDDVRASPFGADTAGAEGSNGVVSFGGSASQISYVSCVEPPDTNCFARHLLNCTNVLGYFSWGYHGGLVTGFPTNGWVRFYDNSGWYIIQTPESYNGQWVPIDSQTSFHDYFTSNAFWGTNYSNIPAGTVTHTYEPFFYGVADRFLYFGLWHAKKNFAICAWSARKTDVFQAVGDPFLLR